MAKGNDGNYLQHCVEVEAAVRLAQTDSAGRLHVALTHGMEPYEQLDKPRSSHRLLYRSLNEAASEPSCGESEIVKAYRASWASQAYRPNIENLRKTLTEEKHYPNTAELLRAVVGADKLSGGITETDGAKHKKLAEAWAGSTIKVVRSSWRTQLGPGGALDCPDDLDTPWLFSMDPMTYTGDGLNTDDDKLRRSDLTLLVPTLERFIGSGQPGIAVLFVYSVGSHGNNRQRQFWEFMDDLAACLDVPTCSYWVVHRGGNHNLAGILVSDKELAFGFALPCIKPGRGSRDDRSGRHDIATSQVGPDAIEEKASLSASGEWSSWSAFPDPRRGEYLVAPFGPGVYELRNRRTGEMVLFGKSKNVADRMSSLLPPPLGAGHRTNMDKRKYVLSNLSKVEYRTKACTSKEEADREENLLRGEKQYIFRT